MKKLIYILVLSLFIFNCNTTKKTTASKKNERLESLKQNDTVSIVNDELEYEILIIEPGFNYWLASRARPEGFYNQKYMENRNYQYVVEWNQRVLQPQRFNPSLYEMQINYQQNIDYGYEVNYKLYNYFIYFQLTYKQRLGPFVPRI
ncbi:hypothetical protein A8C32_01100 [Flavivirga aquatica]|uniref:Uncharacterized protein n=1 Tax=Flavivirga aquatica TaxID=1849968 RepID=A0A1E5TC19_9FLAO|nr:DUF6146 family protein [Flavivirga aquatica]OEK08900.1 hypothetical protein A8C32_01100 [Flavivirga aquatica]